MPSSTRYISVWARGAVLLLAMGLSACGSGGSQEIVAKVDGRPITKATFAHWLSVQDASAGAKAQDTGLRRRVMESLISGQWTLAEASKLGVRISTEEAAQQLLTLDYAQRAGF